MTIVKFGHPVLRRKGERVKSFTPAIQKLAEGMIATMREAEGVGLAAQQVGHALQLCIVDVSPIDPAAAGRMLIDGEEVNMAPHMPMILANPDITPVGKSKELGSEGCLSFPDVSGDVPRFEQIRVRADLPNGKEIVFEAAGFLARVIQHEHDHLHGVLFIDRMSSAEKASLGGKIKRIKKTGEEQAKSGLV